MGTHSKVLILHFLLKRGEGCKVQFLRVKFLFHLNGVFVHWEGGSVNHTRENSTNFQLKKKNGTKNRSAGMIFKKKGGHLFCLSLLLTDTKKKGTSYLKKKK
jgi:hypothetical protein